MSHGLFSLWCSSSGSRSEAIAVMSLSLVSFGGKKISVMFLWQVLGYLLTSNTLRLMSKSGL
jgi:hypothetical protein